MADSAHSTATPDVHPLTGSSEPGEASPDFSPVAEMPSPFVSLGDAAAKLAARRAVDRLAAQHGPDAEVIELAGRVVALAARENKASGWLGTIEDHITFKGPQHPMRHDERPCATGDLRELPSVELLNLLTKGLQDETTPEWLNDIGERINRMRSYEDAVQAMELRFGLTRLEKRRGRMFRRLIRWAERLTAMQPVTSAGIKAKAEAQLAVDRAGNFDNWTQDLAASVGRDSIRIIEAEADVRWREARDSDGELFFLIARHKDAWAEADAVDSLYDAALEIYNAAEPPRPRALYWNVLDRVGHPTLKEKVPGRDSYRLLYEQKDIDEMRARSDPPMTMSTGRADSPEGPGLAWRPDVHALARRDQILAAWDAWEAEKQALRDSSGVTAASDLSDKAYGELDAVHNRILTFQPRTFEGLQTKARWIAASPGPNRFAVHLLHDLCRMPPVAIPAMPAASGARPDPRAVDAYHQFLHLELRYLEAERGMPGAVPWNTAANTFHDDARLPGHTPSARAERVLALLGVDWTRDQRAENEVWPLPAIVESEAA